MTLLNDVFDPAELASAVQTGHVRLQRHPSRPLTIYNYTEAGQYAGAWTPVTLACRGLVVDAAGAIIARPYRKFFNHSEVHAPQLDAAAEVLVTDKADGSLGIIYHDGDGPAVATRGSFASDQALHATELLRARYGGFVPPTGLTVLVEIIYPGNRIVVDYDGLDDLVLLGAVDIATGRTYGPAAVPTWPGPVVETFGYATFAEALAAPPRAGREGLVVHFTAADQRVKIKYADYVRLHRLVTGLTARTVWDVMANGGDLDASSRPCPTNSTCGSAASPRSSPRSSTPVRRRSRRPSRRSWPSCPRAGAARSSRPGQCTASTSSPCSCDSTARTAVPSCGSTPDRRPTRPCMGPR